MDNLSVSNVRTDDSSHQLIAVRPVFFVGNREGPVGGAVLE